MFPEVHAADKFGVGACICDWRSVDASSCEDDRCEESGAIHFDNSLKYEIKEEILIDNNDLMIEDASKTLTSDGDGF